MPKKYYFTATWSIDTSKLLIPQKILLYCYVIDWHIKTASTQKILLCCYVIDTSKLLIPKKYYLTATWLTHQNWLYPKNIFSFFLYHSQPFCREDSSLTIFLPTSNNFRSVYIRKSVCLAHLIQRACDVLSSDCIHNGFCVLMKFILTNLKNKIGDKNVWIVTYIIIRW